METNAFASLSALQLHSPARLLASSCCPDKDLAVLLTRVGGIDRISLWNFSQGSKVWDVDLGVEGNSVSVVDLAWSPDGQTIAVAHDFPGVSLYSLQDGRKQQSLYIEPPLSQKQSCQITGIWWFRCEEASSDGLIPDIFKRGDTITGTAHSVLKIMPLLDKLQEDSEKLTATDLFAFQGSQTRPVPKSVLPEVISSWPTLYPDPVVASIGTALPNNFGNGGRGEFDAENDSNRNSIVSISDNLGNLYFFLDGIFHLGVISLGPKVSFTPMSKHSIQPWFFTHQRVLLGKSTRTDVSPSVIRLPLLGQRNCRDLAKLSSTGRELVWYAMRVVKEMRSTWFGSEGSSGARELGQKWVRALEEKQRDQFGQEDPNSMLDLTGLLTRGRASESLSDFLGSGEQMSERGIQKWESTVSEALSKLRDFSEKRVAPACQRLHLVLEEIQGWTLLPQYRTFELSVEDVKQCLELTSRAIIISSWLAAVARRELSRFKEFISWLRFETSAAISPNENTVTPRHDILEVNHYFMSGLVVSSIDKWFMGPVPHFNSCDLGFKDEDIAIFSVLERARLVLNDPHQMDWQANVTRKDLSHLDRNLDALIQELAMRCRRVFRRAAGAACCSAVVTPAQPSAVFQTPSTTHKFQTEFSSPIKEWVMTNESEMLQHLLVFFPSEGKNRIFLAQLRFTTEARQLPFEVGIAHIECTLSEEEQESMSNLELLEAEFFDNDCIVIVYRIPVQDKSVFVATLQYKDLWYQKIEAEEYVNVPTREDLMHLAVDRWKEGNVPSVRTPIKRCHALVGCKTGNVSVAVNGRVGRRVVCVLNDKGTTMESFDLEGDAEDMEVADDGR